MFIYTSNSVFSRLSNIQHSKCYITDIEICKQDQRRAPKIRDPYSEIDCKFLNKETRVGPKLESIATPPVSIYSKKNHEIETEIAYTHHVEKSS